MSKKQVWSINYKKELQGLVISDQTIESCYYDIHSALLSTFLSNDYAILILEGYMMALIKQENSFYLFDSHARDAEEVGSPSQHALQLINIQSPDFLQCLLEKLWKFISFFGQEYLIFLKVSFYGCFKYESNSTTFPLFGILRRCIYANRHLY